MTGHVHRYAICPRRYACADDHPKLELRPAKARSGCELSNYFTQLRRSPTRGQTLAKFSWPDDCTWEFSRPLAAEHSRAEPGGTAGRGKPGRTEAASRRQLALNQMCPRYQPVTLHGGSHSCGNASSRKTLPRPLCVQRRVTMKASRPLGSSSVSYCM